MFEDTRQMIVKILAIIAVLNVILATVLCIFLIKSGVDPETVVILVVPFTTLSSTSVGAVAMAFQSQNTAETSP